MELSLVNHMDCFLYTDFIERIFTVHVIHHNSTNIFQVERYTGITHSATALSTNKLNWTRKLINSDLQHRVKKELHFNKVEERARQRTSLYGDIVKGTTDVDKPYQASVSRQSL